MPKIQISLLHGAVGRRIFGLVTTIGLLAISLSGCGDNKQDSGATQSSQFESIVLQTFRTPSPYNMVVNGGTCVNALSPAVKTVIEGTVTGKDLVVDPNKIFPAAFAQVDFVCENAAAGLRKPATAWVLVAHDKDFNVLRCQLVGIASNAPFEQQFAVVKHKGRCGFTPSSNAAIPSPVFNVLM